MREKYKKHILTHKITSVSTDNIILINANVALWAIDEIFDMLEPKIGSCDGCIHLCKDMNEYPCRDCNRQNSIEDHYELKKE